MGEVISLHAERWIVGVFEESGIRVDVSTKGQVRFVQFKHESGFPEPPSDGGYAIPVWSILTMEQMARLGEALSVAYKENEDG